MTNVILLTLDCFRKDFFREDVTPYLWNLSKQGIFFENAYSTGPWSPPSITGIMTSSYPLMYHDKISLSDKTKSLAEALKKHGYKTASFTSGGWLSSYFKFLKGFDYNFCEQEEFNKKTAQGQVIISKIKQKACEVVPWILKPYKFFYLVLRSLGKIESEDRHFVDIALEWIKNSKNEKFFLWMHLEGGHEPYFKGASAIEKIKVNYNQFEAKNPNKKRIEIIRRLYLIALNGVDENVSVFIEGLKKLGVLENTYIVICGDHGQGIYEKGYFGHWPNFYEENIHVPLVFLGPKVESKVESATVSLMDISTTILDFIKIERPSQFLGQNLIEPSRGYAISEDAREQYTLSQNLKKVKYELKYYKAAIIKGQYKYIYKNEECSELYNLKTDPDEKNNIINGEKEIANELNKKILDHMAFEADSRSGSTENKKDEETENKIKRDEEEEKAVKDRLSQLGYI